MGIRGARCLLVLSLLAWSDAAWAQTKMTIATGVDPVFSAYYVAQQEGLFKKHGLDVRINTGPSGSAMVSFLINGQIESAFGSEIAGVSNHNLDPNVVIVAQATRLVRWLAVVGRNIDTLEQLKGKKVGVTQYGSEGDAFLRLVLQRAGLKPDIDVQIIQTGGSGLTVTALAAGKIDAGAMGGSVTSVLASRKTGAKTLITAQELKVLAPSGVLATTRRKIARNRDEVRRFIQAYVEGIHFLKNNREAAIRIMQKYMGGLPMDIVSQLYDDARDEYPPLPLVREEAIQAVLDRESDLKARSLKPKDFIDMSFLRELEENGFVTTLYQKR